MDGKFAFCLALPGSDSRGKWPLSFISWAVTSLRQGTTVVTLRPHLKNPSHHSGDWVPAFSNDTRKFYWFELKV